MWLLTAPPCHSPGRAPAGFCPAPELPVSILEHGASSPPQFDGEGLGQAVSVAAGRGVGIPGSARGGWQPRESPALLPALSPTPRSQRSSGAGADAAVSARGCAGRSYLRQQLNSLLSFPLRQCLNPFLPP